MRRGDSPNASQISLNSNRALVQTLSHFPVSLIRSQSTAQHLFARTRSFPNLYHIHPGRDKGKINRMSKFPETRVALMFQAQLRPKRLCVLNNPTVLIRVPR